MWACGDFELSDEMSYQSGLQMFAIMTNWKIEFQKPLTRPGVKHDEEMSICSSIPQAHRGYINSSLLKSDLKMSESHANVVSFDENVSTLSNLYERNEHLLMNETTVENMTTIEWHSPFPVRVSKNRSYWIYKLKAP